MYRIMVLNDGETFTDARGCVYAEVTEHGMDEMELGVKFHNLNSEDVHIIATFQ